MKHTSLTLLLSFALLTGCQQVAPMTEHSSVSSSTTTSGALSSEHVWKTYEDANLGMSIEYPSDEYSITPKPSDDFIQFGDIKIAIEGVRIGDNIPEGDGVQIYRTKNAAILDYAKQYEPLAHGAGKTLDWQEFQFIGMGDVYGYLQLHNGYYYVFESMWGPDNPVSEKMFQSLKFH